MTWRAAAVTWRAAAAASLALALASPAAGEMPQVEPGRFQCNAPAGRPLNQDLVPMRLEQELRVAFRLIREDPSAEHPATAAVMLESPSGRATVVLGRAVNDPFAMFVALDMPGVREEVLFEYPLTKNWIILKLSLDERGFLTVRSNDLAPRFALGTRTISGTRLHCNSGEWEIDVWPRHHVPPAMPRRTN